MKGTRIKTSILAARRRDLLVLAAACGILAGSAIWHQSLDSRKDASRVRLERFADRKGRLETVQERIRRWEEAVEVLAQCLDRVRKFQTRQASPLLLWNLIMERFPSREEVSLNRLDWVDETLTFEGTAATPSAAGTLLQRLEPGAGFSQVELRTLEQAGNAIRFTITARTGD